MESQSADNENPEHIRFEKIVSVYINDIRRLIYSYVKNKQVMEDLTQEVFISVYQNTESFRGESSEKTWLFKIAINKCKDYLKSWHYRQVRVTEFFQERVSQNTPEEQIITTLQNQELARVIMSLPVKYREIIILYYYQELDSNEISELINVNVNTVKTRLIRSRELIKRRFIS